MSTSITFPAKQQKCKMQTNFTFSREISIGKPSTKETNSKGAKLDDTAEVLEDVTRCICGKTGEHLIRFIHRVQLWDLTGPRPSSRMGGPPAPQETTVKKLT